MSILDTFKRFTQPYSEDDYTDYDDEDTFEEEAEPATVRPRRANPFTAATETPAASGFSGSTGTTPGFSAQVVNMNTGKQEVVLFHAKSFDGAAKAADELRKKKAVILNMENVDKTLTRRVVDFLSGSVYALDGSVKKIAQSTYLFCPHNMDVVGDLENIPGDIESYI